MLCTMYEMSKKVLVRVSFDRKLFQKELIKCIKWVKRDERHLLKIWCLTTFVHYQDVIMDAFEQFT